MCVAKKKPGTKEIEKVFNQPRPNESHTHYNSIPSNSTTKTLDCIMT